MSAAHTRSIRFALVPVVVIVAALAPVTYGGDAGTHSRPAASRTAPTGNGLIDTLAAQLGISPAQAGKGVGAVLAMARERLEEQDYATIVQAVPDAANIAEAATQEGVVTRPIEDADGLRSVLGEIGIRDAAAANFV